jgi:hypothetical protein
LAEVLLTIVGCGVNELLEAAVALFDGLFGFEGVAVVAAVAVAEFETDAVWAPDVADRMRYIRAFAVNLFKTITILFHCNITHSQIGNGFLLLEVKNVVYICGQKVPCKMWPQRDCVRPVCPFFFRLHVKQGTDDPQENDRRGLKLQ